MERITQDIFFSGEGQTWENWNGSLLHFFAEEPLPYVKEEEWQQVARTISGLATFANYAVPDPEAFEDWRVWVNMFIEAVNGPTR